MTRFNCFCRGRTKRVEKMGGKMPMRADPSSKWKTRKGQHGPSERGALGTKKVTSHNSPSSRETRNSWGHCADILPVWCPDYKHDSPQRGIRSTGPWDGRKEDSRCTGLWPLTLGATWTSRNPSVSKAARRGPAVSEGRCARAAKPGSRQNPRPQATWWLPGHGLRPWVRGKHVPTPQHCSPVFPRGAPSGFPSSWPRGKGVREWERHFRVEGVICESMQVLTATSGLI